MQVAQRAIFIEIVSTLGLVVDILAIMWYYLSVDVL